MSSQPSSNPSLIPRPVRKTGSDISNGPELGLGTRLVSTPALISALLLVAVSLVWQRYTVQADSMSCQSNELCALQRVLFIWAITARTRGQLKHHMNRNQTGTHSQLRQDALMHLNLEKTLSMTSLWKEVLLVNPLQCSDGTWLLGVWPKYQYHVPTCGECQA